MTWNEIESFEKSSRHIKGSQWGQREWEKEGLDLEDRAHINQATPYKFNPNHSPRVQASATIFVSGVEVWKVHRTWVVLDLETWISSLFEETSPLGTKDTVFKQDSWRREWWNDGNWMCISKEVVVGSSLKGQHHKCFLCGHKGCHNKPSNPNKILNTFVIDTGKTTIFTPIETCSDSMINNQLLEVEDILQRSIPQLTR